VNLEGGRRSLDTTGSPLTHRLAKAPLDRQSLGVVVVVGFTRVLLALSSRHSRETLELVISLVLFAIGSVHGTTDVFKLRSVAHALGRRSVAGPLLSYLALVLFGVAAIVFVPVPATAAFIALSIVHFAVVEVRRRRGDSASLRDGVRALAMVVVVFVLTFRKSSSVASKLFVNLVGHGRVLAALSPWLTVAALVFSAVVLGTSLRHRDEWRLWSSDLVQILTFLVAPSLVVFASYYALRHSIDQWVEDKEALRGYSMEYRKLLPVAFGSIALYLVILDATSPLISLVSFGLGLTLAHLALDLGVRTIVGDSLPTSLTRSSVS
jgi:Brp/Blh family beta-carotene 15,15'-monooxygenase